jgi:hypothetical protein
MEEVVAQFLVENANVAAKFQTLSTHVASGGHGGNLLRKLARAVKITDPQRLTCWSLVDMSTTSPCVKSFLTCSHQKPALAQITCSAWRIASRTRIPNTLDSSQGLPNHHIQHSPWQQHVANRNDSACSAATKWVPAGKF